MLKVYVNSEKIIEQVINKGLENFEIKNDFLKHEKFARAKEFAGQISDLNVWSNILKEQEIKELYSCREIVFAPDIVNWNGAEFELGPNITISERLEHPCLEKENEKSENIVYAVETSMEPKNSALRLCKALGGKMENPDNDSQLFSLGQSLSKVEEECPLGALWMPVFKDVTANWADEDGNAVDFTLWQAGQPNGGKEFEKCAVGKFGKLGFAYWDINCAYKFCF